MALIGINPVSQEQRGPTTFEKVISGLDVAAKILGLGITGAEIYQRSRANDINQGIKESQEAQNLRPAQGLAEQVGVDAAGKPIIQPKTIAPNTPFNPSDYEQGAVVIPNSIYGNRPVVGIPKTDPLLEAVKLQLAQSTLANAPIEQKKKLAETAKIERELTKPILTPGQEQVDKKFAADYADTINSGGISIIDKNLNAMKLVSEKLPTLSNWDRTTGILPKGLQDVVNPQASDIQDAINDVVLKNLRATLGAQFTENEGKRVLNLSYNPRLPAEINQRRVNALYQQLNQAAKAKKEAMQFFADKGTLAGFKGALPSMDLDAIEAIGTKSSPNSKPITVIQNGHTYHLNSQTGEYE